MASDRRLFFSWVHFLNKLVFYFYFLVNWIVQAINFLLLYWLWAQLFTKIIEDFFTKNWSLEKLMETLQSHTNWSSSMLKKSKVWSNENISQNRLLLFVWKIYFNNSNLTSNRYVHKKLGDKNNNVNNTLLICPRFYTKANQT